MLKKSEEKVLEVMCFRQGKKGLDVLLRKENTLHSYWHNFISASSSEEWTPEKATAYFRQETQIGEKLRWAGDIVSDNAEGVKAHLYFTFLTEVDHSTLSACPEQIMWVNSDVLLKKLVERPKKFKPELLEMLTTCFKHLCRNHAVAV